MAGPRRKSRDRAAVSVDRGQTEVVVSVAGDIDAATAQPVWAAVADVSDGPDTGDVIIDLSEVDFIDSSGLKVIAQAAHRIERPDRRLVVANASPFASRLLAQTGISRLVAMETRP